MDASLFGQFVSTCCVRIVIVGEGLTAVNTDDYNGMCIGSFIRFIVACDCVFLFPSSANIEIVSRLLIDRARLQSSFINHIHPSRFG